MYTQYSRASSRLGYVYEGSPDELGPSNSALSASLDDIFFLLLTAVHHVTIT
jgi:hypothetical protein